MEGLILIVEDSSMYGKFLVRTIEHNLGLKTVWFKNYKETEEFLKTSQPISLALLDLRLPDALDGEIIDLCGDFKIPAVVITSDFNEDLQEFIWSKGVVDYVIKEGPNTAHYILDLVERFTNNSDTGILLVDDSKFARKHLKQSLKSQNFKLFEASDGLEALEVLKENPCIKMVLTDYNMPNCDGFELTKKIRTNYPLDKLAIIGLSAAGNHKLAVKFIKNGANDFLTKPFFSEMLFCRINLNLKIVQQFESFRSASFLDQLTNISNRRYLFETGNLIYENGERTGEYPVVAMVDIDNFKKINDTYGHPMGDMVIKKIANTLQSSIRKSDFISRYGGEEFCIVCSHMEESQIKEIFDKLREKVSSLSFKFSNETFNVTVSIGICSEPIGSFLTMIKKADEKLYLAKEQGRNRVCL
jgi:diguanylate cyclase (GGDEF)-like protein